MKKITGLVCLLLIAALLGTAAYAEEAKTYVVGTNAEFPPFEFIDDNGGFAGFDMELIAAILDGAGLAYEYTTMEFDALPSALSSGKIDIAIAAMTINDTRKKSVLFSEPYFHATQKIIVPAEGATVASEADLEGKKVGVQLGTTGDLYISSLVDYSADIERFSKALDAVMDVKAGRLDAVIVDEGVSSYFVNAIDGLVILEETLSDEYYGIAMALGSDDFMNEVINVQLAELIETGKFDELMVKYFGTVEAES